MQVISIQAMVAAGIVLSLAVFAMVMVESGLDEWRSRRRQAACVPIRQQLAEAESDPVASGEALDLLLGRRRRIGAADLALLDEMRRAGSGQDSGCRKAVAGLRRRDQYVRSLAGARRSTRINAAELLFHLGGPSVVPEALRAVLGRRWDVDVYLAILAAARWVEDDSDARLVWLALMGYGNVRPRLAAEIMMTAQVDLVPAVKEFLAGVDRLQVGALEFLLMRSDLVEEVEPDWESLLTGENIDAVCAAIRLYVITRKEMPPRRDHWWRLEEARIAFVGSAWQIDDAAVRAMVTTAAASDSSWWVRYRAGESLALDDGEAGGDFRLGMKDAV